jgi:putative ABC transport system permease protein
MNSTSFKLIFRNLQKDKTISIIKILGFAFSLSACFIIGIYVVNEFSYDKFHYNYDKIFRIVNDENQKSQVDYTIKEDILKHIPEVDDYCHILIRNQKTPVQYQNNNITINHYAYTDNDLFKIFTFPLVVGNENKPFDNNNQSVLLSERIAHKLFSNENPIGKPIELFNKEEFIVCGVFKDFPKNSSIYADFLLNETYQINENAEKYSSLEGEIEFQRTVFLTVNSPHNIDKINAKINDLLIHNDKIIKSVWLQPLKDMYLFDHTRNWNFNKGNYLLIKLFIGIALIILILASINYINISIAQYNSRIKEIGIKKTLGATRSRLVKLFLSESIAIGFISAMLALLLLTVLLPFSNSVFNMQVQITDFLSAKYILVIISLILALGLINGVWPALVITSFNPIQILNNRLSKISGKNYMNTTLTIFQFSASIVLIICTLIIVKQLNFVKNKDLGFNEVQLLKINTSYTKNFEPLKNKLLESPNIISASYSNGVPGDVNYGLIAGEDAPFYKDGVPVIRSDASFIETFQVDILEGRNFESKDNQKVCLINETALKEFGWENNWTDKYFQKDKYFSGYKVIGVFKDFHFRNMYRKIQPIVIEYPHQEQNYLTLRIVTNDIKGTMDFIKKTWSEINPNSTFDYTFYDSWFASMYEKENLLAKMITTFAILAIIISSFGIFSLSLLNVLNRFKEIGIRKVNGAKEIEIMALLNKRLIQWIIIALIIASPTAVFAMRKWLESFAYYTNMSWWIFVLAGLTTLIVAFITVFCQSWKAANINPKDCLRNE